MTETKKIAVNFGFMFGELELWEHFYNGLRFSNRFTPDGRSERFVVEILNYARQKKTIELKACSSLFRARINDAGNDLNARPLEMMGAPTSSIAGHGRLNPRGIPYLYLASDKDTAVSEVRPWVGCRLTVAEFRLRSDIRLIDFSHKHLANTLEGEVVERAEFTWRELITWMFSAPFDPRDDTVYVPTQYLAERIKGNGFDGVMYDSSLNPNGFNVALFDTNSAEPIRREFAKIMSINVMVTYREV
jgi:RES domain-containing protein